MTMSHVINVGLLFFLNPITIGIVDNYFELKTFLDKNQYKIWDLLISLAIKSTFSTIFESLWLHFIDHKLTEVRIQLWNRSWFVAP